MHDFHVIQGPNVTCDAREKIAFFAFYAFVVEDLRFQQNRVRFKLYNCGACVCKRNVEIRIAGSFCHPQLMFNHPMKNKTETEADLKPSWFQLVCLRLLGIVNNVLFNLRGAGMAQW